MTAQAKPRLLAVIREAECIGCTKCIQACPVDAILGSAQKMHTVIADECIGCKLCLPPCPVDCIDLQFTTENNLDSAPLEARREKAAHIKKRYVTRQNRLQNSTEQQHAHWTDLLDLDWSLALDERKTYVQQAVARIKLQKAGK